VKGEARATELGLLRFADGRVRLGPDKLDRPLVNSCSDTFLRLFAELSPDFSLVCPFCTLLFAVFVSAAASCWYTWGGVGLSWGESYSDSPAYSLREFA
jgi:hypothetical protein